MADSNIQIQLLNEKTGEVIGAAFPETKAELVKFQDGSTFQEKFDSGLLKGDKGDTGAKGATGAQGPQGVKGDTGAIGVQGPQGIKGDTGATGAQGVKGDTGTSLRFKGAWSNTVAYVSDSSYIDIVTYNGSSYICKTSSTGQTPTNTTYWTLLAQKGEIGATGAQGQQGVKGDTGATGAQGPQGIKGETGATGLKGADGDSIRYGASYATGSNIKVFFRLL